MRKIITNIEYFNQLNEGLDIPSELSIMLKIKDWTIDAMRSEIPCKNKKSNVKAVKDWTSIFFRDKYYQYICVVVQNDIFKNDAETIFYKDLIK